MPTPTLTRGPVRMLDVRMLAAMPGLLMLLGPAPAQFATQVDVPTPTVVVGATFPPPHAANAAHKNKNILLFICFNSIHFY